LQIQHTLASHQYFCSKGIEMGDRNSKKDKDKTQKQQAAKQGQKDAAKQAKNHPTKKA
jgi:hypothetical protein